MTEHERANAAAAVDHCLMAANLPVTAEERERLAHAYPPLQERLRQMRFPGMRYAEPALIYSTDIFHRAPLLSTNGKDNE